MSDDILNKTFRTFIHESTDEGTRANALTVLTRLIGDKIATISIRGNEEDDELSKLRKQNAALKLAQLDLTDRLEKIENVLRRLNNSLIDVEFMDSVDLGSGGNEADAAFQNNAKQWIIDQVITAGSKGISKKALQAMVSLPNNKASITKRWSEVQNEGYAFLIDSKNGDQVLVHVSYAEMYRAEWKRHERRHDLKTVCGKTKLRNGGPKWTAEETIQNSGAKAAGSGR